ncbi:MAG: nucleotidyltransferase domain-containing protein [Bacteroidota bacterium]
MKFGLKENIIDKIADVLAEHPQIEKAMLYGSRAKGNYKNGSDIDLTLFGEKITLQLINKINGKIDDLLLPYKIDISIFSQISNEELIEHINRVGVILYKKPNGKNDI